MAPSRTSYFAFLPFCVQPSKFLPLNSGFQSASAAAIQKTVKTPTAARKTILVKMHLNLITPASKPQTAPKRKAFLANGQPAASGLHYLLADKLAIPSSAAKILIG